MAKVWNEYTAGIANAIGHSQQSIVHCARMLRNADCKFACTMGVGRRSGTFSAENVVGLMLAATAISPTMCAATAETLANATSVFDPNIKPPFLVGPTRTNGILNWISAKYTGTLLDDLAWVLISLADDEDGKYHSILKGNFEVEITLSPLLIATVQFGHLRFEYANPDALEGVSARCIWHKKTIPLASWVAAAELYRSHRPSPSRMEIAA